MENIYWKRPTASQLAMWKLKESDYVEPVVEVWEENWDVLALFLQYSSQWRMGSMGPIGLDYNVIHHALDRKGIKGEEYDQFIDDMRIIEQAALVQMTS